MPLVEFIETTDGDSHLSAFVDWSAAVHDVLYVVAGREDFGGNGPVPTDNFNGVTVAGSSNLGGVVFNRAWSGNDYNDDALGDRVSIDLLAPATLIDVVQLGGAVDDVGDGTSFAAPHVTGAVALLQQYARFQIDAQVERWVAPNARRHQVMKAILLNSADKLAGVHNSDRTILNEDGLRWDQTLAYTDPATSLDEQMGAGHLNVRNALTNFQSGEYGHGLVPNVGWDYGTIGDSGLIYEFTDSVAAGSWITVTLAWDRIVESTEVGNTYNAETQFFDQPLEFELTDLDIYLLNANDFIVASSVTEDDSVEHIFYQVESGGDFKIVVDNSGGGPGGAQAYGLAWWAGEVAAPPIPGDFDGSGNVDGDDLVKWQSDFGPNNGSDADQDGDSDGNDFLIWQRNLGSGSPAMPAGAPVPEPGMSLLCCLALPLLTLGRRGMTRRSAALFVGIGIGLVAAQPASAANVTVTRSSRSVTSAEIAGGAPAGGMVHDLHVTSDADLLSLLADIDAPLYQHQYGSDNAAPNPGLVTYFPALGADSFLQLPSSTLMLGGGFTGTGPERVWGDLSNDGPQTNFLFGRLTTTQAGNFSGSFHVRGDAVPIALPFTMSLPGSGESLMGSFNEELSLSGSEPILAPPPAPVPAGPDLNQFTPPGIGKSVTIELSRRSRPVSAQAQSFGVPAGYVHEFFVTTNTDLMSIGDVEIDTSIYRRPPGDKPSKLTIGASFAAISADSFIMTPSTARGMDEWFLRDEGVENSWHDEIDDGPLNRFLFARLTVEQTGSFAGTINVRGPEGRVTLPFKFALPGTESDLALLDGEQTYRLELSFDELTVGQVPEPSTWMFSVFGAPLLLRRRAA